MYVCAYDKIQSEKKGRSQETKKKERVKEERSCPSDEVLKCRYFHDQIRTKFSSISLRHESLESN